jgi:phospholipid transport system substrate-binding protein
MFTRGKRMLNEPIFPQTQPVSVSRRLLLRLTVSAVLLAAFSRRAAFAEDPGFAFVREATARLMAIVNRPGTIQDKRAALTRIIEEAVDVDEIAKFCLGRFWRNATPEQQKEYTRLFHDVLVTNITGKIGDYQGVNLVMGKSQMREDTQIVSTSIERPGNPPNNVDWVLSNASGRPRVIDVIAEGTSLRLTQRQDYAAYLSRNNNNVQALIDAMRQQLATNG